jgi:hypothetical protein
MIMFEQRFIKATSQLGPVRVVHEPEYTSICETIANEEAPNTHHIVPTTLLKPLKSIEATR